MLIYGRTLSAQTLLFNPSRYLTFVAFAAIMTLRQADLAEMPSKTPP